jgi:Aspartyl protease
MVDSGADDCLFPRSFLQALGLDPLTLPVDFTGGVGNSRNATHYANITVDIQGIARFDVYAGFTIGMDSHGFGLLGSAAFSIA